MTWIDSASRRSDDMLGGDWKWSVRSQTTIQTDHFRIHAEGDGLYAEYRTNTGKRRYFQTSGPPIIVLVALTRIDGFEELLYEKYKWKEPI